MAIDQQGIMALPEGQQAMAPELTYEDAYDAARTGLQQARPDADLELQDTLDSLRALLVQVTDEQLEQLISAVQALSDDPENYARNIAEAIKAGDLEAGVFPEEYDEEFLGAILTVLLDEKRTRAMNGGAMMPPPQQFARGGIAEAARLVASKGRNGDTMLAHITPSEARLLRSRGGSGTINPETGLPEYFLKGLFKGIGKVFSAIGSAVKSVLKSPIGRIVGTIALATVLGPGGFVGAFSAPVAAGVASGAVTALSGGDIKSVLTSAVLGYAGAPGSAVSNFVGNYTGQFLTNPIVKAAADAAIVGTGGALLTGQSFKDAVKSGLTTGAIAGGMSFAQNRNVQAAKVDAEQAAAANATPAPTTSVAQAVSDIAEESVVSTTTPGLSNKITKYTDGRVIQQMVDGRGAPIGPATPVGAATPTPTPAQAPSPSAAAAPSVVAPSAAASDYLQGLKASRIRENFSIPTPRTVAGISQYDLVPPPSVGLSVDKLSGGIQPNLANVQPLSGGIGNVPMPRTSAQVQAPAPYAIPEISSSLSTMGRGIKELGTGQFSTGAKTFMQGAEDLFFPGPSDEQIRRFAAEQGITPAKAAQEIGAPGFMRTYGPGVAAVTGIGALGGAFERKEPPVSEFAKQMRMPIDLSGNPKAYYIQDIPGAVYNEQGAIIGTRGLPPPLSMADISYTTPNYSRYAPRYAEGGDVSVPDEYEKNARQYIVQDLPGVRYGERGTIAEAGIASGTPAQPLTLESVRAPIRSYSGYQSRFFTPPSIQNQISAPPSIQNQTSRLFEQYVGTTPNQFQSDYWSGIFGLDNQITPDEIQRLQNAVSNAGLPARRMNMGGIAALRKGGYPRRTGQISGPGTETSDSIPAMLSDGEFVMTARAVRGMGNGSRRDGARKMYALMHKLERNAARG